MVNRPTTVLSEQQVHEILHLLDKRVAQWRIAEQFHVSTKSINRISTGETWGDISRRYKLRQNPPKVQAADPIIPVAENVANMLDELTAVKNHFALSFKHPVHWGWFDSWDGLHAIATDGYIAWESADLVSYAQRLQASNAVGEPVYADLAEEVPTFDLEHLMSHLVGNSFSIDTSGGGISRLYDVEDHIVFLQQKYVALSVKMQLEIRRAEGSNDAFVYLTKLKPNSRGKDIDPYHVPIACITTLQE